MVKIGIVDTTFARINMAEYAIEVLKSLIPDAMIVRYTVPGVKDIPVAAKKLIEEDGCDIVMTFGWIGKNLTDKLSYVVYSTAIQLVQLITNKHVIDVTVHEDEAVDEKELAKIAIDRAKKHAENVYYLLRRKDILSQFAGMGKRQGYPDIGPLQFG